MQGLGLPVEEIAERLDCRITILCWDQWYHYEQKETWVPTPATRPVSQPDFINSSEACRSPMVRRIPIPTRDPDYCLPFDEKGLSPRSYGLIYDSGLLFFASYCLNKELQAFYNKDPFHVAILPMWGGVGYVAQMARATQVPGTIVSLLWLWLLTNPLIVRCLIKRESGPDMRSYVARWKTSRSHWLIWRWFSDQGGKKLPSRAGCLMLLLRFACPVL